MTGRLGTTVARRLLLVVSLLCLVAGTILAWQASAQQNQRLALVMSIEGAIGPATLDYFRRGLDVAAERDAELVVVQMDTPGGLDASMRDMIRLMLNSTVPVASHVYPSGARAASAGTYLLYGSHVAAMAPATHLGSATPVQMGGGGLPGLGGGDEEETPGDETEDQEAPGGNGGDEGEEAAGENRAAGENGEGEVGDEERAAESPRRGETAMERKVLEDAVAYIRSLAERHGRNADWAEEAVREAVNLTAERALERNVIDVVADDIDDLLEKIDGREVVMDQGRRVLDTQGLAVERFDPDWRTQFLKVITNPNVAYFLMIIGFYGLVFELSNPGSLVPGTIGIICLLLALFAFQVLPVNYAGLALILVGLGLIVGEALMPSFGILGIGGIVAFVIGSVILMDEENLRVSLPLIGGIALLAGGFMLWTVSRFMGLRRQRPKTGQDEVVGSEARAVEDFEGPGHVRLMGERWNALSHEPVSKGQRVRVVGIEGLTVEVEPMEEESRDRSP